MRYGRIQLALSVVFTLASLSAQAAPVAKDNPFNTQVDPNLLPGLEFNIGALWLKPGASNLNYTIYNVAVAPPQSPFWSEQEVQPTFSAAFDLGARYVFPNASNEDVRLDWTHLSTSNSAATSANNFTVFLGPDYEIGPSGVPIRNATATAKFNYDVVNLDVGQYLTFGQHADIRLFGGLSTGFLREEVVSDYSGTTGAPYAGPFNMNQDVTSNFTGVGPRIGLHADYNTNCGLGFLGEAAVSALIGSEHSITNYIGSGAQLQALYHQTLNYQTIQDQNVYQVVPGLDAKLGVDYKHTFNNADLLTVSAGYQAAVYFNAISQYLPASLVSGTGLETGGIYVATMSHTLSNYSVQGPFVNVAFKFS